MLNNKFIVAVLIVAALLTFYFAWRFFQDESVQQQAKDAAMEKVMETNPDPTAADPRRPSEKGPYGKYKTRTYDNSRKALDRSVNAIDKNDAADNPDPDAEGP